VYDTTLIWYYIEMGGEGTTYQQRDEKRRGGERE
jgi:hypothetical protein